jgi:hypothetical protein
MVTERHLPLAFSAEKERPMPSLPASKDGILLVSRTFNMSGQRCWTSSIPSLTALARDAPSQTTNGRIGSPCVKRYGRPSAS